MQRIALTWQTTCAALYIRGTKLQAELKSTLEQTMKAALHNEELEAALIPKWDVGCRRLAPDTGYLQVGHSVQV